VKDAVNREELDDLLQGTLKDVLHGLSKKVEFQDVEALKHHTDEQVSDLHAKYQHLSREMACVRAEAAGDAKMADLVRAVQSKANQEDIEASLNRKVSSSHESHCRQEHVPQNIAHEFHTPF
jgi:hypothetical protein